MTVITLPHNFTPRPYQENFFSAMNKGCKRAILVWNRRAGKDTCAWNYLIYTAYETKGIYYYVFPTFSQGRKVLWDGMTNEGHKFIDFIPKPLIKNVNNQEMKVRLINGSLIQIVGSDNYDAIMGTNPTGCIFSEYSLQNPNAWQFMRPILDANGGWAIFVFTPRGSNHAKVLYDMAQEPKNKEKWYCEKLTNNETHTYTEKMLADMESEGMSPDMLQQEIYCSFTLGIMGSYYAKYIEECRNSSRIGNVPHDNHVRVCTSFDLGYGDSTVIIFFQVCGNELHIIDHYENHGKELAHYAKVLKDKPYIYDRHFAPHDIDRHELSMGLSPREVGADIGLNFVVLPTLRMSLESGIEAARSIFPRIWIDENACKKLIVSLENYRCEYDEGRQLYKPKPVHDKHSHSADAYRYMAVAIKAYFDGIRGPGDDDVRKMEDLYRPRFD